MHKNSSDSPITTVTFLSKELAWGFTVGLSSLLVVFSKLYNSPARHSAPICAFTTISKVS